jgi:hypothetical protein
MKKNSKFWLVVTIIGLLLLLFLDKCRGITIPDGPVKIERTTDTTYITTVDTLWLPQDTIYLTELVPIGVPNPVDSTIIDYTTHVEDSLLSGDILSTIKRDGTLINQDFSYVPKFPKYIYKTDSIIVNNTIKETYEEKDWGIYGGIMISPYKNFSLIPTLGLKTKKDMYFGVGYEPFQQNILVDFKIKLFNFK